eukprot:6193945-Pleurochrysis_carterae.AAC.1
MAKHGTMLIPAQVGHLLLQCARMSSMIVRARACCSRIGDTRLPCPLLVLIRATGAGKARRG